MKDAAVVNVGSVKIWVILDIDGFTGEFNLQAEWATGALAGNGLQKIDILWHIIYIIKYMRKNDFEKDFGNIPSFFEPHRETTPITDSEIFDGFRMPYTTIMVEIDAQRERTGGRAVDAARHGLVELLDAEFHDKRMAQYPPLVDFDFSTLDGREWASGGT